MEYLENHNADPKPFIWTKSAGQILEKVARAKQALKSTAGAMRRCCDAFELIEQWARCLQECRGVLSEVKELLIDPMSARVSCGRHRQEIHARNAAANR